MSRQLTAASQGGRGRLSRATGPGTENRCLSCQGLGCGTQDGLRELRAHSGPRPGALHTRAEGSVTCAHL